MCILDEYIRWMALNKEYETEIDKFSTIYMNIHPVCTTKFEPKQYFSIRHCAQ